VARQQQQLETIIIIIIIYYLLFAEFTEDFKNGIYCSGMQF
jgi:hypothetical protein